ncbi:uncharacterized protein LOC132947552 [Metopolophium dirhodum]|uniref:uncharacterized protein LOC132947391 n=1 Tax=Metopolophium dirhodum TaxID=44670 RepID=UPI0029902677|nr:uncharacterized protein LOC132947391 [Metopolophium dirhodum]XP_060873669.1 uncharacterized protein LOC132947407 [Metopolophium dirhodum]XP_060873713.1 uncharacterized protein LOC132947440 [Metopolophium dirhodum]XP_060873770.1 uncharacterized protein LOC132947476 [Metopolophium dirhodum]XP_060873817.1 uncharacterized protein LOC132947524 [Metopolophium dirhodum]XP_060873842.1 uncharacterized protein LOC132947552 [Metopolophium dirhodum]
MEYTSVDHKNAEKYAEYNFKVRMLERLLKKAPHLASYLEYTVRDATSADFYIPISLKNKCKIIDIKISKRLCEKLSCNKTREKDMCTPDHIASYYRVGDDKWDVQCQPACFNMTDKPTYEKNGEARTVTPWLNYAFGECRVVPQETVNFLEKPFYRSDVQYEKRVNDMPTGYSRIKDTSDPYGCGFTYVNNETYCNYYDTVMIKEEGKQYGPCSYTGTEHVLDVVVGMNLINTVKSTVRSYVINQSKEPFALPTDLVKLPEKLDPLLTVKGWRSDVNTNFKLPQLMNVPYEKPIKSTRSKRNVEKKSSTQIIDNNTDDDDDDYDDNNRNDVENNEPIMTTSEKVEKTIQVTIESLIQMVKSPELWESLAINLAFETTLSELRKFCVKTIETLQPVLTKNMITLMEKSFSRPVITAVVRSMAKTMVTRVVLKIAAKSALMLAKVTLYATNPISWILLVAMALDFAFGWWDPYGYQSINPVDFPMAFMRSGEIEQRQRFNMATVDYNFQHLVDLLLDSDDILEFTILAFFERAVYINSLSTNSDGVFIDKSEVYDLSQGMDIDLNEMATNASLRELVKRSTFDKKDYDAFNKKFLDRVSITGSCTDYATLMAIGVLVFAFSGVYLLAFLFLIVLLILLGINRHLINDDTVIKLRDLFISQSVTA